MCLVGTWQIVLCWNWKDFHVHFNFVAILNHWKFPYYGRFVWYSAKHKCNAFSRWPVLTLSFVKPSFYRPHVRDSMGKSSICNLHAKFTVTFNYRFHFNNMMMLKAFCSFQPRCSIHIEIVRVQYNECSTQYNECSTERNEKKNLLILLKVRWRRQNHYHLPFCPVNHI